MSERTDRQDERMEERAEPATTVPLLRDPSPPPGYVDPIKQSELLAHG